MSAPHCPLRQANVTEVPSRVTCDPSPDDSVSWSNGGKRKRLRLFNNDLGTFLVRAVLRTAYDLIIVAAAMELSSLKVKVNFALLRRMKLGTA